MRSILVLLSISAITSISYSPVWAQTSDCIVDFLHHARSENPAGTLIQEVGRAMAIAREVEVVPCSYAIEVRSTYIGPDQAIPEGEYVVYNIRWVRQVIGDDRVQAVAIFGHELGHFVQGHFTSRRSIPSQQKEIEADYFAGCAVASMKMPWAPMKGLLDRIRDDKKDDEYPDRLSDIAKAKEGYDTCSRAPLPVSAQPTDLKLQVASNPTTLTFLANGRVFATADIHDFQNGAGISASDIVYGRNSVMVRLGWAKDMFTIFEVKESEGKLCSKQLFVALRDGDGIGLSVKKIDQNTTTYGVRYGREHDLFNEYVADNKEGAFSFDPSAPRTGEKRNPSTNIPANGIEKHSVVDLGCR